MLLICWNVLRIPVNRPARRGEDEAPDAELHAQGAEIERAQHVDIGVGARIVDRDDHGCLRGVVIDHIGALALEDLAQLRAADIRRIEPSGGIDLLTPAARQTVDDNDLMPGARVGVHHVRPNEPGAAGDQGLHRGAPDAGPLFPKTSSLPLGIVQSSPLAVRICVVRTLMRSSVPVCVSNVMTSPTWIRPSEMRKAPASTARITCWAPSPKATPIAPALARMAVASTFRRRKIMTRAMMYTTYRTRLSNNGCRVRRRASSSNRSVGARMVRPITTGERPATATPPRRNRTVASPPS